MRMPPVSVRSAARTCAAMVELTLGGMRTRSATADGTFRVGREPVCAQNTRFGHTFRLDAVDRALEPEPVICSAIALRKYLGGTTREEETGVFARKPGANGS